MPGGKSDEQLELFGKSTKTMCCKRRPTIAAKETRSRRSGGKKPPPPGQTGFFDGGGGDELDASLQEETRRRYLSYALSVITSRALPDVRDGLKPVQRRILYAMGVDERLYPDAKHRKSAKVVGAVIGKYHPHGDTAVYDAMVRMAQDFSLRLPLVDGSGNFGSLDGDGAAAYRYTECRLAPPSMDLLEELKQQTVPYRSNFDGTADEPVVLPARYPNLLVNGSTGIAVGMATNIPPHNLKEVTDAAVALIDKRTMTTTNLLKYINGPDFPTGGQILNTKVELRKIYETGSGAVKVRGQFEVEAGKRGAENIVITSIPYAVNKSTIVEKIAEVIIKRKLPQLVDVRDESTTDVRIVLELKKDAAPDLVMAYLWKHTPLQQNFNVNLTCLFPTHNSEVGQPQRVGIKEMLEAFIDFRFEVTRKRFQFELDALRKRIHILEGFVTVFDALDQIIKIIRRSEGKKDAANKIMKKFDLDEIQTDAILELKLYRLAKLEILVIREELTKKRTEARKISGILKSKAKLWTVVKQELREVAQKHHTPRRTKFGGVVEEVEFDASDFIVDEDAEVLVTRDGWIKRQQKINVETTRLREGDAVMAVLPGSTKSNVVFFSNKGAAYVTRINDITPTSGYGDPAQKYFKFKDGERVVSAYTLDERAFWDEVMLAVSANGFGLRFDLEPFEEVTTRAGRRYARPKSGDEIIGVVPVNEEDVVVAVTQNGHVLYTSADQINHLEGPGKGVTVIKTGPDDRVIGFISGPTKSTSMTVQTVRGGKQHTLYADPKKVKARGGKGHQIVKRSKLAMAPRPPLIMELEEEEEE